MTAALLACLNDECIALQSFVDLLENETETLLERISPTGLPAVTERKNALADELAALSEKRDIELDNAGFGPGHAGTEAAVAAMPELAEAWSALRELVERARNANERNGMLIHTYLLHTQQSLNALRTATGQRLYGADGRQRSGLGGKRLGAG